MALTQRSFFIALAALGLAIPALSGCEDFNRAIGREKVMPDEFAVVSRAPLSVPPDFALRPPRIGAQRPQEVPTVDQARQTVFRSGDDQKQALPPAADKRSPAEGEFLREAGAAKVPADIRQLVDTDAANANNMSDSFVDKLAFWRKDQKPGSPDQVIDPTKEAARIEDIKERQATGQPVNAALTAAPTIERTPPETTSVPGFSWFTNLF